MRTTVHNVFASHTLSLEDAKDSPALYELPFLGYPLADVVEEVLRECFPDLGAVPAVQFGSMKRVAYCEYSSPRGPLIMINGVLNHSSVPREIIRSILIHEFLHIQIRPREIEGKSVHHPPEFWQREAELNPQIRRLWDWFNLNFLTDLIRDEKRESTRIRSSRLKRKFTPYISVEDAVEFWAELGEADRRKRNLKLVGL